MQINKMMWKLMDWYSLDENNAKCKLLSKHPEKVDCFNDAYALPYQKKTFGNKHLTEIS